MAETHSPPRGNTPSAVPMKRPFDDAHTPNISSPLNPDAAARPGKAAKGPAREQREKKDSLKKRESTGVAVPIVPDSNGKKQKVVDATVVGAPSPIRYNHALPREASHFIVKDTVFASHEPEPFYAPDGTELKRPIDNTENKKMYRYTQCVADPTFFHSRFYRQTDNKPFGPRMSFEDSDRWFHFSESATIVTNEKGWRMGRANVVAREGRFYYEVKIQRGVPQEGVPAPTDPDAAASLGPLPHVRMGWARREAPLDAPVGFDGYSYGLTDIRLEPIHKSRASKFLDESADRASSTGQAAAAAKKPKSKSSKSKSITSGASSGFAANDHAREGDVIGLEITLPSLSLQRKIADGSYNPAVDVDPGLDTVPSLSADALNDDEYDSVAPNIVRDRFPVPYKGAMHFESMEYRSSRGMEAYGDRGPFAKETPSPNHSDASLRCLPHSSIRVWKNGKPIGTAFRNLMAFLPPASAPAAEKGVRQGFDDGMLGYFPAIGLFSGGVAEINLGPKFWYPPPGLEALDDAPKPATDASGDTAMADADGETADAQPRPDEQQRQPEFAKVETTLMPLMMPKGKLRGIGERYAEQIAEDVVYDILDEVDFYVQDGGGAGVADE